MPRLPATVDVGTRLGSQIEAAQAALDFLKEKLPAGIGDNLEDLIAGNTDSISDAVGGLTDNVKGLLGS